MLETETQSFSFGSVGFKFMQLFLVDRTVETVCLGGTGFYTASVFSSKQAPV